MLILVLLLLLCQSADALRPDIALTQQHHTNWNMEDGLPSLSIRTILQSKDGYLWIATATGLTRFDGSRFQLLHRGNVREMTDSNITALLEDGEGTLWIGTDRGGLLVYKEGKYSRYGAEDGLADNHVVALGLDATGNIWIASPGSISVLRKDEFFTYDLPGVHSIASDTKNLWIGTEKGISVFDGMKFEHRAGDAVTAVYRGPDGNLWLGIRNRGVYRIQGEQLVSAVPMEQEIHALLQDRDQNLWIGTEKGLYRFNKTGLHADPMIQSRVNSLLEDHEGNVWVTAVDDGVYRLKPTPFVPLTEQEGLIDNRTSCVVQDKTGNLWFGTAGGISKWKDGVFTNYRTPNAVRTMAADVEGSIWIGTDNGVSRFNGSSFDTTISGFSVNIIVADKQNVVWIGAKDGLRRFMNGQIETLGAQEITSMYKDLKGILWVGTKTGLMQWKEQRLQPYLITDEILSIQEDREGRIWVGAINGVHSIQSGRLTTYTMAGGLFDDFIFAVLDDRAGNLWMSGRRGIFRVQGKPGNIVCTPFGVSQGLPNGEGADGAPVAWKASDGAFWFVTRRGIAQVHPDHYFVNKVPPPVKIESLYVDRGQVRDFERTELHFPAGTSLIEFRYTGMSYVDSVSVKFRYVLQGFDKFWTNAGPRRSATYTNLPPGKYRFKLLACNDSHIWNTTGTSIEFDIASDGLSFRWSGVAGMGAIGLIAFAAGWLLGRRKYSPRQ